MDDLGLVDRLLAAIDSGAPALIVGVCLLLIGALARRLTRGRVTEVVEAWVSMGAMVLSAVGAALLAGGVWWRAVVFGLASVAVSGGLWDLLDRVWPARRGGGAAGVGAVLLLLAALCGGCGDAQVPAEACTQAVIRAAADVAAACWPRASEQRAEACPLDAEQP